MKTFFIMLFLCISFGNFLHAEQRHVEEGKRLLYEEAKFLNSKSFKIFGSGGSFLEAINTLELTVEVPVSLDVTHARLIFISNLIDWINKVNLDTKAKPFFRNDPMTLENFEFRLLSKDFDAKSSEENPKVSFLFNQGEKLVYCLRDECTGKLQPFFKESFGEALRIFTTDMEKINPEMGIMLRKAFFE